MFAEAVSLRSDNRTEHTIQSCASACAGSTEGIHFTFCWSAKRQNSHTNFQQFSKSERKPCWGNHFWARDYCVDTVGLDSEMIRKYVKYQDDKAKD
jgi:putative transposase